MRAKTRGIEFLIMGLLALIAAGIMVRHGYAFGLYLAGAGLCGFAIFALQGHARPC